MLAFARKHVQCFSINTLYLQKQRVGSSLPDLPDLAKLLIAKTSIIFTQMLKKGKCNIDGVSQTSLLGKAKKHSNGTLCHGQLKIIIASVLAKYGVKQHIYLISGCLPGESTQSTIIRYKKREEQPKQDVKNSETEEKTPRYTKQQKEYLLALLGTSKLRNDNNDDDQDEKEESSLETGESNSEKADCSSISSTARKPCRRSHSTHSKQSNSITASTYLYKPERVRAYISDNSWSPNLERH